MDLRETRIGECGPAFICAPDSRRVAVLCIGRKIKHICIAARREHYGVGYIGFDSAGHEISRHNAACMAVDHYEIEHLGARVHLDVSGGNLALERLIRTEQELLSCLSARIKRS